MEPYRRRAFSAPGSLESFRQVEAKKLKRTESQALLHFAQNFREITADLDQTSSQQALQDAVDKLKGRRISHESPAGDILAEKAKEIFVHEETAARSLETFLQTERGHAPLPSREEKEVGSEDETEIVERMLAENYGLTLDDYLAIGVFYDANKEKFERQEEVTWYKQPAGLTRSVVYVPEGTPGRAKGLYVLLKTKGGMEEAGIGRHKLATRVFYFDGDERVIFLNGSRAAISDEELEINQLLVTFLDHFVPLTAPFFYVDAMRPRGVDAAGHAIAREANEDKQHIEKEQDIEKVGGFMTEMSGNLYTLLDKDPPPTLRERFQLAIHLAKGYALLHSLGIVHYDPKPENILMDGTIPKIADFGTSKRRGEALDPEKVQGTAGFIALERYLEEDSADPNHDIWGLGAILAEIFERSILMKFDPESEEGGDQGLARLHRQDTEAAEALLSAWKQELFGEERKDPSHPFSIIDDCLRFGNRPTAAKIVERLEAQKKIYEQKGWLG